MANTEAFEDGPAKPLEEEPEGTNTPQLVLSPHMLDPDSDSSVSAPPRGRRHEHVQTAHSPNARSTSITTADGKDTEGRINRHPAPNFQSTAAFSIGVATDKNKKCRRTMEDAHAFIYDFANVPGQGYFAVFDGHAGKHAAEWCGAHFHEYLLSQLSSHPDSPIPDLLNSTFHKVDAELSKIAAEEGTHSGCTAVTAFLRIEDGNGRGIIVDPHSEKENTPQQPDISTSQGDEKKEEDKKRMFGDGVHREKLREFFHRSSSSASSTTSQRQPGTTETTYKRALYTANVGDARAVLCRAGKAVRLTYDHKGSDVQEAKRITDAGGFVMNNRVNGVLAVTRSLGDSSMKEFVVGSPYTTETILGPDDAFLIVACDGLWDVCEDQEAVDLILNHTTDAQEAAQILLDYALSRFSSDNVSIMVIALGESR